MGKRLILATAFMLASSVALAEHGVMLEPDTDTTPAASPVAPSAVAPETATAPIASPAAEPVLQAQASYPAELDVYLVPAATREVCTIGEWGFGEIRTECHTEPIPMRREDPALRGLCVTRYGQRTCY
ncbi:MAG TPA: hypothetical protein VMW57_05880 [Methyloceanibacter sp.]|nr:hypothetical protein [Methyloceanibacter sp.]